MGPTKAPAKKSVVPSPAVVSHPRPASPFHNLSNRMLQDLAHGTLRISEPNSSEERHTEAMADAVMEKTATPHVQRKATSAATPAVNRTPLPGSGHALPGSVRNYFEPRMGHEFGDVRVHTDAESACSALSLNARAYTLGRNIVFGGGEYAPGTQRGDRLLAHELTHVVQQKSREDNVIRRQLITPLAPGGGFGGLMERDRQRVKDEMASPPPTAATTPPPFQVCSRPLQSVLGSLGINHAFIDAPPYRYAVISPLCTPTDGGPDNPVTGTVGQKWDNSPDPCGKSPVNCVPCDPAPGVTDVAACLRDAFASYNNPSLYKGLGPNSNTFAGTLARACCAKMAPKPPALGVVPGWDAPPARHRPGICPPGPTC